LLAAAVCLALGTGVAAGAGTDAGKSNSPATAEPAPAVKNPPKPRELPEAERARIEKQLADVGEKLTALQQEELELSIKVLSAETQALANVKDRKNLKTALTKGPMPQDVVEYRNVLLACAQQWRIMEGKYAAIYSGLRYLEQKREEMPDDLKSSIEEVVARILKSRRSCMEKVASIYSKLMDNKTVLDIYVAIYRMLPDDQREADTVLKAKILELQKKLKPPKKP
jgi:hypothetical protein